MMMSDEEGKIELGVIPEKERGKNLIKDRRNNGGTYLNNEESMLPGPSTSSGNGCVEMLEECTKSKSIDDPKTRKEGLGKSKRIRENTYLKREEFPPLDPSLKEIPPWDV